MEDLSTSANGKTPIELSVGDSESSAPITRAVVIDGHGKVTAFENDTRLHLLMVSQNVDDASAKKYTVNYGLAQGSGTPPVNVSNPPTYSSISFNETQKTVKQTHKKSDGTTGEGYYNPANETVDRNPVENNSKDGIVRYWDDAHARKSALSIYGFCINGTVLPFGAPWNQKIDGITSNTQNIDGTNAWKAGEPSSYVIGAEDGSGNKVTWKIGDHSKSYNDQTFLSVLYKDDICYSNNIANYDIDGTENTRDKRLKFDNLTKKFDTGVIEFHRAVSLITILIKPGQGFSAPLNTDFKFATNKNVEMQGFNKEGYLNLSDGTWSSIATGTWNSICNATAPTDAFYTLMAFVLPGNDLNGDTDAANKTAMIFSIDGNEYKLSKQDLLAALKANGENCDGGTANGTLKSDYMDGNNRTQLKAGINYQFTMTVGKTAITGISASVVDWKTITAEAEPDNAHALNITMETSAGGSETPVASYLYKSATTAADLSGVEKGYSNSDRYSLAASTTPTISGWYWPSNSTYYHLRTISPQSDLTEAGTTNDNYITMTGGAVASAQDYVWGAPLKENHGQGATSHPIAYDQNNGYGSYLFPAIGPTKDNIHITQFHMMTDLEVKLLTTNGADAVTLTGATVELVNYANQAKLMIGKGLVSGWGDIQTSQAMIVVTDGSDYTWRTVPQALSRGSNATDKVGLKITLTDGNIYEIKDLSTLPVKVNGSSTASTIQFWEPGRKYVYTLTLKKTAIDNIQATIVDWETVEATYDDVKIQ